MKKLCVGLLAVLLVLSLTSCDGVLALFDLDAEELLLAVEDLIVGVEDILDGEAEIASSEDGVLSEDVSVSESFEVKEGIRPEFKEAVDAYEAFIDDYVDFMKEYEDAPSVTNEMIVEYMRLLSEYNEQLGEFSSLKNEAETAEEAEYFARTLERTKDKLDDIQNG